MWPPSRNPETGDKKSPRGSGSLRESEGNDGRFAVPVLALPPGPGPGVITAVGAINEVVTQIRHHRPQRWDREMGCTRARRPPLGGDRRGRRSLGQSRGYLPRRAALAVSSNFSLDSCPSVRASVVTSEGKAKVAERDDQDEGKRAAARQAATLVEPGMRLGLGTGSTVEHFLAALAARLRHGELEGVVGVATSRRTEERARAMGIPLAELGAVGELDLAVDGADEVDPSLDLIKGGGGALLREKIVAQAARRFVVIVDEGKLVGRLGTRGPLPVEVVPFAWHAQLPFLRSLGALPVLRTLPAGNPFVTDDGHFLLDCTFPEGISEPGDLEDRLARRAGIVESGLFVDCAREVWVGGVHGVRCLRPPGGVGADRSKSG